MHLLSTQSSADMKILLWFVATLLGYCGAEKDITLTPDYLEMVRYLDDSYIVSCESKKGIHIMWTTPSGDQVTQNKGRIHVETGHSKNGSRPGVSLVFESINKKDRGNYTCSATVDGTEVKIKFALLVIKPISFMDTSPLQFAKENSSTLVRCEVQGDPEPTIMWQVKGKAPEGPKYKVMADGLFINNITLEDKGDYHCRAFQLSPITSSVQETKITLKIEHKPTWILPHKMEEVYGFITGYVNLSCEADAEPQAEFQWFKGNNVITPASHPNATVHQGSNSSILQLYIYDSSLYGDYKCKASNAMGSIERKLVLLEGSQPEPPTSVTIGKVTAESVELVITGPVVEGDNLPVLGYRIFFRSQRERNWDNAKLVEFNKAEDTILTALTQDTMYLIRVATRNAAGYSEYNNEVKRKTTKINADQITGPASTAANLRVITLALLPALLLVPLL